MSLTAGGLSCRPPTNMKPSGPIDKNDSLGRALQQWTVDAAVPPRFHDDVWRRIRLTEARHSPSWWRELLDVVEGALCRPALAVSYVTILLLAGLSIGFAKARQESARMDKALGARYVQSVDPYQAPRHP